MQHEGKAETIRIDAGEVVTASDSSITVKENDGSEVTISVDDETKVLAGPGKETAVADLKEGQHVVVCGPEGEAAKTVDAAAQARADAGAPRGRARAPGSRASSARRQDRLALRARCKASPCDEGLVQGFRSRRRGRAGDRRSRSRLPQARRVRRRLGPQRRAGAGGADAAPGPPGRARHRPAGDRRLRGLPPAARPHQRADPDPQRPRRRGRPRLRPRSGRRRLRHQAVLAA